ncbi:hypothetical protein Tco_0798920 [Tanacetum coccineum]
MDKRSPINSSSWKSIQASANKTFDRSRSSLGLHENDFKPRSSMFKRRLIAADQASVFMEMMSDHNSSDLAPQRQEMSVENVSSGLVLHQMTSDQNRSELGIQDHNNEQSIIDDKLYIVAGSHNGSYLSDFQNQVPFTLEQQWRITSMLNTLVYNAMSQNISRHNRPSPIVVAARTHEVH